MTLVGALVTLFASLAALLLVLVLLFRLRGFEQSLEQGLEVPVVPGGSFLLLGLLVLAAVASLALVAVAILGFFGGSRSRETRSSPASTPYAARPVSSESTDSSGDGRWMNLVEECVGVVDDLDEHMDNFDPPRQEVARHVILRLEEVLGRSGVEIISNDATFDRARHKPSPASATSAPGAAISETLSPGFAVGRRVLRRARVRVE